ncbi:MAG: AAA family ATPase [Candidatus Marinimicrobia bacterium]|jgi:uncharacterized protein|nr:AAA family ATPase [Candidatus Neomarinimicrobiota bacterium]MBT5528808.1 AAA family ATPase [Cytophagia bacterium]
MLIRFVVENFFSFGERKEFTTIPSKRLKTLQHHKYNYDDFNILKIGSIYGANGSGKSNLIKSLGLFQKLILSDNYPSRLKNSKFKLNNPTDSQNQVLAVEFFQERTAYYYGIIIKDNIIVEEELYLSGLGKKKDVLLYIRKTDNESSTSITFNKNFEKNEKILLLKSILLEEFVKSDEPILKLLSKRDNILLNPIKVAFNWFQDSLQIITPSIRHLKLAHSIDVDKELNNYTKKLMCSFNLGITELISEKMDLHDFFSDVDDETIDKLISDVDDAPEKLISLQNRNGNIIIITQEDGKYWVKNLKVGHKGKRDKSVFFNLSDESDGTIRLLDFVPAFNDLISEEKVYIIDEVERSIHPLLIKQLIQKFSLDKTTKGQLFFSTHESNLLDQEIFRQDEIWFIEKNIEGSSDLYSLNDFKEHKTIDIRKGYLSGRYGSVPFLGNLHDLNWNNLDSN